VVEVVVLLFSGFVRLLVPVVVVLLFSGVMRLLSIRSELVADGLPAGRETVPSERVFPVGVVVVLWRVLAAVDAPPRTDVPLREFS
jgi:hypothetical protein